MRIDETSQKIFLLSKIKNNLQYVFKNKFSFIFLSYFLIVFISLVAIFEFQSIFYTYQKAKVVIINSLKVSKNFINSFPSEIEEIKIDINHKNLQRLEYIKSVSAEHYIGLDNEDEVSLMRKKWVPAEIGYNGDKFPVKIRIKGQSIDHWGKFPSYKIKVTGGNTILGMKRFALQHPKTRGFMNEWYFHKFLKYNGLINLRYDFVNISVNGDTRPVYALEENFGKRLLENNSRKDGLIFRILKSQVQIQQPESEIKKVSYMKDGIDDLNMKIRDFYNGKLVAEKVFDIESMAKLYAIIDLWGNRHAIQLKNTRFYFNPITTLIEPIAYDQQVVYKTQHLGLMGEEKKVNKKVSLDADFFELLFNNEKFYLEYVKQLEIISDKTFLDNFFDEISSEETKIVSKLYKSYPYYEYKSIYPSLEWLLQDKNHTRHLNSIWLPKEKEVFYENQRHIRDALKINNNSLIANKVNYDEKKKIIQIEVYNNENLPIVISAIKLKSIESKPILLKENKIVQATSTFRKNSFIELEIKKPLNLSNFDTENMFISASILGSEEELYIPLNNINTNYVDRLHNFSDLDNYQNIILDESNKTITFKSLSHVFKEDLIIQPGYTVHAKEGTVIELKNNSNLISYSPFIFTGTQNNPIEINSDKEGSVTLINTQHKSVLYNIIFKNLSDLNYQHLNISGGINFYQADVDLISCSFMNSLAEDAINIIRSNFFITDCSFKNIYSDAIDIDFGNGIISDTTFKNVGNDSIDVSGSNVDLDGITIIGSSDKGISVGERSSVNINHIEIYNAKIALAVKDKSIVHIDRDIKFSSEGVPYEGIMIDNCEYGIAIYQKKPEYGPAEVFIGRSDEIYKNISIKNTKDHFIVEKGSYLKIGSQRIENYYSDVFKKLYN